MLLLFLVVAAAVAAAALLYRFANSDGDFTLITRGPPKRAAVDGKVVWITGASSSIGAPLAKKFANLGAKLILSARSREDLERLKNEIVSEYPACGIEVLPIDLASGEESLKGAVETANSLYSGAGVDFMIHNAAYSDRAIRSALELPEEALRATFEVNIFGTISLTRLLAPSMLKKGSGHFVVMSSAAGKVPAPGQSIYSASKHALNGYFNSLRSELCQKGIKVTVVCPGPIGKYKTPNPAESVSEDRCAELAIVAATHGLREAWISYQPVLLVMYLVQYMPSVGFWLMDKIGAKRLEAASKKRSGYGWALFFGGKKSA